LLIGGGFTSKKNPGKKSGKKNFQKIIHGNPGPWIIECDSGGEHPTVLLIKTR